MPWWLSWTLENTRPSTCPASGPLGSRERYKQRRVLSGLHTASCLLPASQWWMCLHAGEFAICGLACPNNESDAAQERLALLPSDVQWIWFIRFWSSPSAHTWIFICLSLSLPLSLPLLRPILFPDTSVSSLCKWTRDSTRPLGGTSGVGTHANSARRFCPHPVIAALQRGRWFKRKEKSLFLFFLSFLSTFPHFSLESLWVCGNINLHTGILTSICGRGDVNLSKQ